MVQQVTAQDTKGSKVTYVNESTEAKNCEERVDVAFTGEVQASPHMAAGTAHSMGVPVAPKEIKRGG